MALHKNLPSAEIHIIQAFTYANASARIGATGLVAGDVGKVALQTDNMSFWVLTNYSPVTWIDLAGTGVVTAHASTHKGDGSDPIAVATQSVSGLMSAADKTKLDSYTTVVPDAILWYGAGSVGTSTTTRYLVPGYTPNMAPVTGLALRAPRAGTLMKLRVRHNSVGVGGAITYTVYINGSASTLTVSPLASSSGGSDTTHAPTVAADDLIEIRVTKGSGITTSPGDVMATVEFNG